MLVTETGKAVSLNIVAMIHVVRGHEGQCVQELCECMQGCVDFLAFVYDKAIKHYSV